MESALAAATDELDQSLHADAVLDAVRTGINKGWSAALQCERDHLVNLRHTPPAQEAITAFFNK